MTLKVADAEEVLKSRLGGPVRRPTQKVIGFKTAGGRILALERGRAETRIWYRPPAAPALDGVESLANVSNKHSNLKSDPLHPLSLPDTCRVQIHSATGLDNFLDWYA